VAGTLDAVGTSSQPIIFTSENDNSVGASTGSGTPAPGDWAGISIEPGDPAGSIDLENSVIEFDGGFGINAGLLVQDPNPTLDNDVVENVVGVDYELDSVGPFDNISDVTGAGSGRPVLDLVAGRVATTTLNDEPIAWLTGPAVYVPSGVTLTIAPGTVIKSLGAGAGDPCNVTINLCVAGTLDAVGTSSQPIIFTSENDNSVGASTGSGTPAPGDWAGIAVGGSVELSHTTVKYAGTGIYFDGTTGYADSSSRIQDSDQAVIATSGVLSFRGTLVDNLAGISACDWLGGCVVDAFYARVNQEDLCGAVTTPTTPLFADNCDSTPNPDDILDSAVDAFGTTIETETEACDAGTEAACAALAAATSCINDQVASLSAIYSWMPGSDPVEAEAYADDAVAAVSSYVTGVEPLVLNYSAGLESFASDVVSGATGIDALAAAYAGCN
jgi:hypothetical protein